MPHHTPRRLATVCRLRAHETVRRTDSPLFDAALRKHVGVLEKAALVVTEKVGRVRTCRLGESRLEAEVAWLEQYRELWAARFEGLDRVMETKTERRSDCELVVTRIFEGPARLVFQAWTTPELLLKWWTPKSFGITFVSCEVDARTGGSYKFVFNHPSFPEPMAFFGRYLEVIPNQKIVWTNEESPAASVTTLTLEERARKTYLVLSDVYPNKEALDEAMASGSVGGYPEQFTSLDELLGTLS